MVSIRKRRHVALANVGNTASSVSPKSCIDGIGDKNPDYRRKRTSIQHIPSVTPMLQPVEVTKKRKIVENATAKKRGIIHEQIDPANPIQVHSYLMQLKEENKLELAPKIRKDDATPVKEWMESRYPDIFTVFPQEPNIPEALDKLTRNEFLYCRYWFFIFGLRNLLMIDHHVSPAYVETVGELIESFENQGFDCRFMRSEVVVFASQLQQRKAIVIAEKEMVVGKIVNLEKQFEGEAAEDEEYGRIITVKLYKKMLDDKEEEEKKLNRLLVNINRFNQGRPCSFEFQSSLL